MALGDGAAESAVPGAEGDEAAHDVCLLVEGTYPYVSGGVSAWTHDLIGGHGEYKFSVFNVGSEEGSYGPPRFELAPHVTRLHQVYCREKDAAPPVGAARARLERQIRALCRRRRGGRASRVLAAIRRLTLGEAVDDDLLEGLVSNDLSVVEFLHGGETFDLIAELAERLAPDASFLDLFWHFRAIYVPVLRLIGSRAPRARCFHTVSTGYAGLCGAVFSVRTGRPLIVTEHGIYTRERNMDLARANWIREKTDGVEGRCFGPPPSPLRRIWSRSFRALAALAYHRASRIVTLSEVNRARQIADGAPAAKIAVVPNGVDVPPRADVGAEDAQPADDERRPLRVGFVGRVVPIKDVVTFIRACHLAMADVDLDVRVIGPFEEDPQYARRCRALVETLGRASAIRFVGPQPPQKIYGDLDVVVLTSFSEGQPLVILEAYAAGVPVVATDVGACREMIEGRGDADRQLGPSGIVTRVGTPGDTASALVRLAREPRLRRRLGLAGRQRVLASYRRQDMLDSYRNLYREMVTQ